MSSIISIIIVAILGIIGNIVYFEYRFKKEHKKEIDKEQMTKLLLPLYIILKTDELEFLEWDKIGADLIDEGKEIDSLTPEIDCVNYEYEWESARLSCQEGKAQLGILARDYISLGEAYIKLSSDSASEADMSETIRLIDRLNSDFQLEMVSAILDLATIDEIRKTNSYNKAILKAALESDN